MAMVSEAVCFSMGTEMAHWLLLQMNSTGALVTPAKLSPEWKSLLEVPPSPKYAALMPPSPLSFWAMAVPVAWMMCVPMGLLMLTMFSLPKA